MFEDWMRGIAPLALAALIAGPALAQGTLGPTVSADLNGDGVNEAYSLVPADGVADLHIQLPASMPIVARGIAWDGGGPGRTPELSLAPNGSLRITSMNESIGRDRWRITLTIAHRQGSTRVAGYTYSWYDTLENDNNGVCDLNLLTGKGTLEVNGDQRPTTTALKPLPVTEWHEEQVPWPIPGCETE